MAMWAEVCVPITVVEDHAQMIVNVEEPLGGRQAWSSPALLTPDGFIRPKRVSCVNISSEDKVHLQKALLLHTQ
jgi:hypothetical protein